MRRISLKLLLLAFVPLAFGAKELADYHRAQVDPLHWRPLGSSMVPGKNPQIRAPAFDCGGYRVIDLGNVRLALEIPAAHKNDHYIHDEIYVELASRPYPAWSFCRWVEFEVRGLMLTIRGHSYPILGRPRLLIVDQEGEIVAEWLSLRCSI